MDAAGERCPDRRTVSDEEVEMIYADEPLDIVTLHIPKGTISGVRFRVKGMVRGEERVIVEHITKLRDEDYPDVAFNSGGYRVEVKGEPNVCLDMELSFDRAAANNEGPRPPAPIPLLTPFLRSAWLLREC